MDARGYTTFVFYSVEDHNKIAMEVSKKLQDCISDLEEKLSESKSQSINPTPSINVPRSQPKESDPQMMVSQISSLVPLDKEIEEIQGKGMRGASRRLRIMFKHKPNVLLLQETVCSKLDAQKYLKKCLPGYSFLAKSSTSNSGGLVFGWNSALLIRTKQNILKEKSLSMAWAKLNFQQEDRSLMEMEDKIKILHGIFLDEVSMRKFLKELDTLDKEKEILLAWYGDKSSIYFYHVPQATHAMILKFLPFSVGHIKECFRYLGFMMKANDSQRRLVLIKSVLKAISVYWLSLAYIPKSMLKYFKAIFLHYLWSGSEELSSTPLVIWDIITRPKSEGGWDLKDLPISSRSLVAKGIWHLISKKSLWKKVLILSVKETPWRMPRINGLKHGNKVGLDHSSATCDVGLMENAECSYF
eukprot:Gb_15360 [translate_table: standard]